ncbi:hypothetical protein TCA2_3606 [Paenibacillus sp. TCA20]|uniref:glycosyltransferase n=1 Tax=Paenibacillus sp. TCA20 TaxID=1499968 RepID=UPI0004DA0BBC|nr:glycosyltransferase [Paenibacillus sp. TCA20]GAK41115.1 hypothetical protein TCA2_3606 [Paenibacillus sp. TCA20]
MRVLALLSDAFGGHGGISKFNRDLLNALCSFSETTEVIALPRVMPFSRGEIPDNLTYLPPKNDSKIIYLLSVIKEVLKRKKIDLIVCGHINIAPLAKVVKYITNVPVLMVIHGIDAWEPIENKLVLKSLNSIDHIISVSQLTLNRFKEWSNLIQENNYYILPNSFEPGIFKPGNPNPNLLKKYNLEGKKVIMTLGRLAGKERYKGFDEVIEAMPFLIEENPNLVYLIVGDGIDKARLTKKVDELNLSAHVVFTGMVSEVEKVDHYRLADAFVLPSRGEGFGIVLLEAMACGIPVLASKIDGSSEALMNGKLGYLVDPRNTIDVVNGIKDVIKKEKGIVPEELDYFSYKNYEKRVHNIIIETRGVQ